MVAESAGVGMDEMTVVLRDNAINVFSLNETAMPVEPKSAIPKIPEMMVTSVMKASPAPDVPTALPKSHVKKRVKESFEVEEGGDHSSPRKQKGQKKSRKHNEGGDGDEDDSGKKGGDDDDDDDEEPVVSEEENGCGEGGGGDDDEEESGSKDTSGKALESYYGCPKCRAKLFTVSDLFQHSASDTVKTVFKVGEEGLCQAMLFIKCSGAGDAMTRTNLEIKSNSVQCSECRLKLGKYILDEGACACGVCVAGPVIRLLSAKVDFFDKNMDMNTLAHRMLIEAHTAQQEREIVSSETDDSKSKKQSKKKEKIKVDNRGNFSSYRNKDFRGVVKKKKDDVDTKEEEDIMDGGEEDP
jgi:hypothetical protein